MQRGWVVCDGWGWVTNLFALPCFGAAVQISTCSTGSVVPLQPPDDAAEQGINFPDE